MAGACIRRRERRAVGRDVLVCRFVSDCDASKPVKPVKPVKLYRGATLEYARGWSWTGDVDVAEWFARRNVHHFQLANNVYVTKARPIAVAAILRDQRPREHEYVLFTDLLDGVDVPSSR